VSEDALCRSGILCVRAWWLTVGPDCVHFFFFFFPLSFSCALPLQRAEGNPHPLWAPLPCLGGGRQAVGGGECGGGGRAGGGFRALADSRGTGRRRGQGVSGKQVALGRGQEVGKRKELLFYLVPRTWYLILPILSSSHPLILSSSHPLTLSPSHPLTLILLQGG